MKKKLLSLVGALVCVAMLLSMAGCGEQLEEAAQITEAGATKTTVTRSAVTANPPQNMGLIGDWVGTFDKSVQYSKGFGFDINASMTVKLTFKDDGYCVAEYNQAELYNNVISSVMAYCEAQGKTINEFYAQVGHDADSFRLSFVQNGDVYEETKIYDFTGDKLIWYGAEYDCEYTGDTLKYSLLGGKGTMTLQRSEA